jgi:hypothetical protein
MCLGICVCGRHMPATRAGNHRQGCNRRRTATGCPSREPWQGKRSPTQAASKPSLLKRSSQAHRKMRCLSVRPSRYSIKRLVAVLADFVVVQTLGLFNAEAARASIRNRSVGDLVQDRRAGALGRRTGQARCLPPCRPHPSRLAELLDDAVMRWSGRSLG